MHSDIDQVLIHRSQIAQRVEQLAHEISRDLIDPVHADDGHSHIALVPILTGSLIFVADLIRHLPMRMQIRLISVSSYPDRATTSQGPNIRTPLDTLPDSLDDAHVLVIDDILDSGRTLQFVTDLLRAKNPRSLRTCVMLRKQRRDALSFPIDYFGFDIPDSFVVGYGLDYNNYYRNLPDIVTLRQEVFSTAKGLTA